jgi:hypothetical protein
MSIYAFLLYAYSILADTLSYHLGDTEKEIPDNQEHYKFVRIMDYINVTYRNLL